MALILLTGQSRRNLGQNEQVAAVENADDTSAGIYKKSRVISLVFAETFPNDPSCESTKILSRLSYEIVYNRLN